MAIQGNGNKFITLPESLATETDSKMVRDKIYSFAKQFEGHEVNNLDENENEYKDPLDIPLQSYLDFFDASEKIWNKIKKELHELSILDISKKKNLEKLKTSISEDTERVAEALVTSIAEKIAEKDHQVARLLGRLEGILDSESILNDLNDNIVYPTDLGTAEEFVEEAKKNRSKATNELIKGISPTLSELNLLDPIQEWIMYSD